MSFYHRPIQISDLPQCIEIAMEPIGAVARETNVDARTHLAYLLKENQLYGAVVFDEDAPNIVAGFGTNFHVTDGVIDDLCSGRIGCMLEKLLDRSFTEVNLLSLPEQDKAHRSTGLNTVSCFSGWIDDREEIKSEIADSAKMDSVGLWTKSYYKMLYEWSFAEGYSQYYGLPIIGREKLESPQADAPMAPVLVGATRQEWERFKVPKQPVNEIFRTKPPKFGLSAGERKVLQLILRHDGLTNEELAEATGIPVFAIRDAYRNVVSKILIRPARQNGDWARSKETRRELIRYLRDNPQDMRPWVTLDSQLDE